MTNNTAGAVRLFSPDVGQGSGAVIDNTAQRSLILTAAHALVDERGKIALKGNYELRLDNQASSQTFAARLLIPHPTSLIPDKCRKILVNGGNAGKLPCVDEPGERIALIRNIDLGVVVADPITFASPLQTVDRDELQFAGATLTSFGYGPLQFLATGQPVPPNVDLDPGLHRFSGRADGFSSVKGWDPRAGKIGQAVALGPGQAGSNFQFIVGGDSGGPVLLNDGGNQLIMGVNSRGTPNPNVSRLTLVASLFGYSDWLDVIRRTNGTHVLADFDASRALVDQLFVVPSATDWTIHVEEGGGGRRRQNVSVSGLGSPTSFDPKVVGYFDNSIFPDAVGILNTGRAVAVMNPAAAALTVVPVGTASYSSVLKRKLNSDQFTDIEAKRSSGGATDFFFGTPSGLSGPFSPGALNTCRAGGPKRPNACGGKVSDENGAPAPNGCWCTAACNAQKPCCSDFAAVCQNGTPPGLLDKTGALEGTAPVQPVSLSTGAQPLVDISAGTTRALGVFLDKDWILTPDLFPGMDAGALDVVQVGGSPVSISSIVRSPTGEVALLRVSPGSVVSLPAGQRTTFFSGTAAELADEDGLTLFASDAMGAIKAFKLPQAATLVDNANAFLGDPIVSMLQPSGLFSQSVDVLPGSPLVTQNGELAAITLDSAPLTAARLNASGTEQNVTVTLHDQVSLARVNQEPADGRASPRYFAEQVLSRDQARDADDDGLHDFWAFQKLTADFFPSLLTVRGTSATSVAADTFASEGLEQDVNWRFVGRAKLGSKSSGVVWHDIDGGDVLIQRLDDNGNVGSSLQFNVAADWKLRGLGDIDGDGVADFIWSNPLFDTHFFWLMNDLDAFPSLSDLTNSPADAIRFGNWFNGMPLVSEQDLPAFELVGVDQFRVSDDEGFPVVGPEQAAADLIWQEVDGEGTVIAPMTFAFRSCGEIVDELMLASCGGPDEALLTYELARSARTFSRDAFWRYSGSADYNTDGQPDLVWHARGEGAADETGHVEVWLSREDGEYDSSPVTRGGEPFVVDPAEGLEIAVR